MTPQDKLNKITNLLKMVDESLTREEFTKSFGLVVELINKWKGETVSEIIKFRDEFRALESSIQSSHNLSLEELKTLISSKMASLRGSDGRPGKDGQNGKDSKVPGPKGEDGVSIKGTPGENGRDGSPDTPKQIRDKLETLTGDERLDVSAVKGMRELIKAIPERPTTTIFGPGKTKVYLKDFSSELNGVTKIFTIGTHYGITGVFGSSTPFIFRPLIDYNEVGKTIVFTSAIDAEVMLATGQSLVVQYLK